MLQVPIKETKRREKNSLNLSVEALQPHFGKKLKDVAEELGIGRSTIKSACRELGIPRWPNRKQHLFKEESAGNSEHSVSPSIGNLHPLDDVTETNADKVIVKDGDGDEILLTRAVDLQVCPKSRWFDDMCNKDKDLFSFMT
ncbi:hypothetical protein SASPL_117373 [Salvia splendens]|uniref:RWP-RK domain-containing protein n=1 Tax=Salvia splendens TaxID=180675 RepID=A0A8X8XUV2_SALSN|nr:hypothetical protein SASPL_117373 [Salvia splendens]